MTTVTMNCIPAPSVERTLMRMPASIGERVLRRPERWHILTHRRRALVQSQNDVRSRRRDVIALAHSGVLPR